MIAQNTYGQFVVPTSSRHRPAARKILSGEIYEPETIDFIRNNCKDGDVIHAGTYFGDFLPGISAKLHSQAILWAFEPNAENYECAGRTIAINNLTNVKLFNVALGSKESKGYLLVENEYGKSLGGASMVIDEFQEYKSIEIKIVRIDDIIPKNRSISIIHLDVEGYEKETIIGAMQTIRKNKPILILEDNKGIINSKWFTANVLEIGYNVFGIIHGNTVLLPTSFTASP